MLDGVKKVPRIDPVCAFHGKPWSEHVGGFCYHCPLCFRSDEGYPKYVDEQGQTWDVCKECGELEKEMKELGGK